MLEKHCHFVDFNELFDMHAAGMQKLLTKLSTFVLCYVAQLSKLCEVLEKHCHFVDFNELFDIAGMHCSKLKLCAQLASCVKCWKNIVTLWTSMNFFDMHAAGMQGLLTKLRLLFVLCCTARQVV